MGLKEIYYSIEDKYYDLLESIDKVIPITKLTDKIDKVIPSFPLFVVLIVLILGFLLWPVLFPEEGSDDEFYSFVIQVKNDSGLELNKIEVMISLGEEKKGYKTNSEGKVSLQAKKDTKVKIEIDDARYKFYETEFTLEENNKKIDIELEEIPGVDLSETVLRFEDEDGQLIIGKEITLRISCRNPEITPEPDVITDTDGDGKVKIKIPRDCGKLIVDAVEVTGYENWFGTINSGYETIQLEETIGVDFSALGDLRVVVENTEGELLNEIEVSLMEGNLIIEQEYTVSGVAYFNSIEEGYYDLLIQDLRNDYKTKKIYSVEIENTTVNEETIVMELFEETAVGDTKLEVTVFDKEDGSRISNAQIILENGDGEVIATKNSGETGETVEFVFNEVEELILKVSAEGYVPREIEATGETSLDIALEKAVTETDPDNPDVTPNSGKLVIKVVDEDGKKVTNARIMLKDEDESILSEYPVKFSNAKGEVTYIGVKEGSYFAYAEKYPASGLTEEFGVLVGEETRIKLTMTIGNAVIKLQTVDPNREPVPNTRVKVKSIDWEREYTLDSEGKTELELKADKRVYFYFYDPRENYASFTTKEYQLYPDKELNIEAVLEPPLIGDDLWLDFKGVYYDGERIEDKLTAGEKYTALFHLSIPENHLYNLAGMHFRTGEDDNIYLENDIIWIEKINVPQTTIIKGTTWNPTLGQDIDFDPNNLASANARAKWTNIEWRNLKAGTIYKVEIEIKVKEEIDQGKIKLHYRAWGKGPSYFYYPPDYEIGSAGGSSIKQGLYAEAFEIDYGIQDVPPVPPVAPLCASSSMCMTEQKLLDKAEEPFIIQRKLPFKTKTNGNYEYYFKIVNDSDEILTEPEVWIKLIDAGEDLTDDAEITYYEIKTASGTTKRNNSVNSNKTPGVSLGLMEKGSVIEGTIGLKTEKEGIIYANVGIVRRTAEGGEYVFNNEKATRIDISSGKELHLEVAPELIPAFVETPVTVTVKDEEGIEVEDARVSMSVVEAGNRRTEYDRKNTTRTGEVEFLMPPFEPGTIIEFKAEKFHYEEGTIQVELSKDVFTLEPTSIREIFVVGTKEEIAKEITIKNLLEIDLRIRNISLENKTGYFENFINTGFTNKVFESFRGEIVPGFPQEFEREMFKAKLRNEVQEDQTGSAVGIISVELESPEFGAVYAEEIEVKLSLGGMEPIPNPSCIEIVTGETNFTRQTTDQEVQLSYDLENTCKDTSGRKIKIHNLQAKVNWSESTGKKGSVELSMKGDNEPLKTTEYHLFSIEIIPEEQWIATLTYTPDPELTGEEGIVEFEIEIMAEIFTSTGTQEIHTDPQTIKGNIGNINLLECIEFEPGRETGLRIEAGEDEVKLEIQNHCGIEVKLRLCEGQPRCDGETEEKSDGINISKDEITLRKPNSSEEYTSEEITIARLSIPGIYGIPIRAKKQGDSWRTIVLAYDVLIEPKPGYHFSLNDYTIKVPNKNIEDVLELKNESLIKLVDVKASKCAWDGAKKGAKFSDYLTSAGAGAVAGASIGATVGSIIPGVGTVIGGVVGAVVGTIAGIVSCIFGGCPNPCEERNTAQLVDYWINLSGGGYNAAPAESYAIKKSKARGGRAGTTAVEIINQNTRNPPNLKSIELTIPGIEVTTDFDNVIHLVDEGAHGVETIPIIFEKVTGEYDNIEPTYGILEINAAEHNQQAFLNVPGDDDSHKNDLMPYGLPDRYANGRALFNDLMEIKRKYHVRAITKTYIEEIPPLEASLDCIRPTGEIGALGENALPKIKLNWDWENISINECEVTNENYIYCDSTQFAIMLNQRINEIDEFMEKNGYYFSCPTNPIEEAAGEAWEEINKRTVPDEKVGIKEISVEKDNATEKVKVSAMIKNNRTESMQINVRVNVSGPLEDSCSKSINVSADSEETVECEFDLIESNDLYIIEINHVPLDYDSLEDEEKEKYDLWTFEVVYKQGQQTGCWAGTSTGIYWGKFPIDIHLNGYNGQFKDNVTQGPVQFNGRTVPTDSEEILDVIKEIEDLSHFNVYLIKDGFSQDFKRDFADYYENKDFLGTPEWFSNGLVKYYKQDDISFNGKYLAGTSYELPVPGLYKVDVAIEYRGDEWNLYNDQGNPNAKIKVEFTRLNNPTPNSIMYWMPFDGKIGEENGRYHRAGYGIGYKNLREEQLRINQEIFLYSSDEDSEPIKEITVERSDDIVSMNSRDETRGSLFNINYDGSDTEMTFYPSKATPVAMKMFHKQTSTTDEAFNYYYGMQENNLPVLAGTTQLTYWKGMGACRDFEGRFVQGYGRWDAKAESGEVINFQNKYKISWDNANKEGNTFFKTVFYTPIERNISLKVDAGNSIMHSKLYTPDEANSEIVGLRGIAGMQYNNSIETATSSEAYLSNIQNVFDLVKDGKACISQNNVAMNIYWNEANLFREEGSKNQSLQEFEQSLEAGTTCIE